LGVPFSLNKFCFDIRCRLAWPARPCAAVPYQL